MLEFFAQGLDELCPAPGLLVPGFELVSFALACVPAHGRYVDHAVAELDECAAHGGEALEVGDVLEAKLGEFLVRGFAKVLEEGGGCEGLAEAVGG